jgi:hypothetical protein
MDLPAFSDHNVIEEWRTGKNATLLVLPGLIHGRINQGVTTITAAVSDHPLP